MQRLQNKGKSVRVADNFLKLFFKTKNGNIFLVLDSRFSCHSRQLSPALSSAYVHCTLAVSIANKMDPDQTEQYSEN